jgi:4-hydroxy-tetrahydrodipicolinate synthase
MSDEEQLRLIELALAERPQGATIVAGTGTNDTREVVHLTERATELGVDGTLIVTPYYNKPSRLGITRHYETVAKATDRPILVYNIPGRTATNMPPDLLAELAQIEHIDGVKQANGEELQLVDGMELYAGDDSLFARTLDLGFHAGGLRLPLVPATEEELAVVRALLVRHGLLGDEGQTQHAGAGAPSAQAHTA